MSDSVGRTATDDPAVVDRLRETRATREDARDAVEDVGRDRLVALRDALDETHRLFDKYEEHATGTGDFESYLSFQDDLVAFIEDLPENLPQREVFEGWLDDFKKRRLTERDFDRARDQLADARDLVDRLDHLDDARNAHRQAVSDAKERRSNLRERIQHLERVQELGDADLDAPVDDLHDPIDAYNDAVRADFQQYLDAAAVRAVLDLLDRATAFPLVDVDSPPEDLTHYVESHEVGTESVPRLLELAGFSRSKLQHFVDDPASFKRVVGGNRTYLDGLSAGPFTLDWPPGEASLVARRVDELISLVGRFADEDAIARLRDVQRLARTDRFDDIRRAAIARDELTTEDRERLRSGAVEDDLASAKQALERVTDALDEYA